MNEECVVGYFFFSHFEMKPPNKVSKELYESVESIMVLGEILLTSQQKIPLNLIKSTVV